MSSSRKLYISQLTDPLTQSNFKVIGSLFNELPFLKGQWDFRQFTITASGTNQLVPHGLKYTPTDVLLLSQVGGTIVFNYSLFDATNINVTSTVTSGPLVVRVILGKYSESSMYV